MSYELAGNPDTIYAPVDKASSSMIIITVTCIFLFIAIFVGLGLIQRLLAHHRNYPGFALDHKTKFRMVLVGVCLAGTLLGIVAYAVNPFYRFDQQARAQEAIADIRDRFDLEARWEFTPYDPFDDENDQVGKLYIEANGREYPTRISPTEFDNASKYGPSKRQDLTTLVVEVLTDQGYVPISQFSQQVNGVPPAY